MVLRNSLIAFSLLFIFSCGGDQPLSFFEDDFTTVPEPYSIDGITPDTTETGLIVYVIDAGNISSQIDVGIRDVVNAFFTGRKTNGEVFDSSFKNARTQPNQFTVANLINGFTEGILGMKEGGRRVLVIPPGLAYANYQGPDRRLIELRDETLIFDIELETIIFN